MSSFVPTTLLSWGMLKRKWDLQKPRQFVLGSMVTKKGDGKNQVPGSGRKGCQVSILNWTAQSCSFLSAKMKIQSQTMDVFFCHNIFFWLERGFRTMITWLLCRQSSSLYYEVWETGTTWTGDTIHEFQVPFEFTFVAFQYSALILALHFYCNEPQADLQGKPNGREIAALWIFVFLNVLYNSFFSNSKVKIIKAAQTLLKIPLAFANIFFTSKISVEL